MRTRRLLGIALALAGLVGCSVFPARPPERLVLHDFGPAHSPQKRGVPVFIHVRAPSWLAGTRIPYRLLYRDPTAVRVYADNRWLASPGALLKARIRQHLGMGPYAGAPQRTLLRLVLHIARFGQSFRTPERAAVHLTVRMRLYRVATGALLGSKTLALHASCAPNVSGAVTGLSALGRKAARAAARFVRARSQP